MKNSGMVWNEDTLKQYLAGEKMIFAGIKNEQQLDDLIVYLREATQCVHLCLPSAQLYKPPWTISSARLGLPLTAKPPMLTSTTRPSLNLS